MKTYAEYKAQKQAEFNALPLFWAFSREQFAAAMAERGLTERDVDKVFSLPGGSGAMYLKSDAAVIREYFSRPDELPALMEDPAFAEEAFYSEMANHEYHINWQGDWDVCSCFGNVEYLEGAGGLYYLAQMGYGEPVMAAYRRAATRFFKDADENGWF